MEHTQKLQTILVVDDEADLLMVAVDLIKRHRSSTRILTANCGKKALELVHAEEPDLIISDLNMYDGDGHWLLAQLKDKRHIPIVIQSGKPIDVKTLRDEGAIGLIKKPYSEDEIQTVITLILGE